MTIEIIQKAELYYKGKCVGSVRNYNPKRHEAYVTLNAVGIEEWGAMDSDYYAVEYGQRIPNKWDNKVDPQKAFFGEN